LEASVVEVGVELEELLEVEEVVVWDGRVVVVAAKRQQCVVGACLVRQRLLVVF
jgi:hypothetical protein